MQKCGKLTREEIEYLIYEEDKTFEEVAKIAGVHPLTLYPTFRYKWKLPSNGIPSCNST